MSRTLHCKEQRNPFRNGVAKSIILSDLESGKLEMVSKKKTIRANTHSRTRFKNSPFQQNRSSLLLASAESCDQKRSQRLHVALLFLLLVTTHQRGQQDWGQRLKGTFLLLLLVTTHQR
jgi:hypothetical protein